MSKKQLTKTYYVSDFSKEEKIASIAVHPTGKHATAEEAKGMLMEIRMPEFLGGRQSGVKIPVDPDFHDAKLEFVVRLSKGSDVYEITDQIQLTNPVEKEKKIEETKNVAKRIE